MQYLLYFLIALGATTVGAMTGMGGGVIIKPLLDILGDFDVATIGLLSSVTVFVMALVSIAKQMRQKVQLDWKMACLLSVGSMVGGSAGQWALTQVLARFSANRVVLVLQNVLLALLIIGVFFYMLNKSKLPSLGLQGGVPALLAGILLGLISSFLGIGGGPINVALLIFLFSTPTKTATVYSIITILFAQISKLSSIALGAGFAAYDLSLLLPLAVGGVLGGFLGAKLNKALPERRVEYAFNGVQVMVFCFCILNIVKNL